VTLSTSTPTHVVTQAPNPLLSEAFRIPFHRIRAAHVEPGTREVLTRGQARLDALVADPSPPEWNTVIAPLDELSRWVDERLKPVGHLLAVAETPELRQAFNAVLPEISAFWTRLGLNAGLWERLRAFAATPEARALTGLRKRHLDKTLLEFRRAGAELPPDRKARLEEVRVELSRLEQRFGENVLDATAAWELLVEDEDRLEGVPEGARGRFRTAAEAAGKDGWLLSLDYPSVEPILKYALDRDLRREVHAAYTTRCREGDHDNRGLILDILRLRKEQASLLGYESFPDYVLEERMARSRERAYAFECEMTERTRPYWRRDVDELVRHAGGLGLDALRPWDVAFVAEDLRRTEYALDDEDLRPYFPLEHVQEGLFELARRVFGLRVTPRVIEEVWHADVRHYELHDADGTLLGAFYTDWFPRKEKRQGAWMNDLHLGGPLEDGRFDPHLGVICGNFTPPDRGRSALLTHREVQTLFHEFGHLLHHATSRVPIRARGGLNVAWDWVEVPSQLMENWTWEREALDLFARHHTTGEPLPYELFERMRRARRFQGGWAQMRQLAFGTVDLRLHAEFAPRAGTSDPDGLMTYARERFLQFSPEPEFAEYHNLTSFSHLFSGGYAAGYYSYLWSEVLEADAFTRFREEGIFNAETGRALVASILARGDSEDPEVLLREFLGRDADPRALFERNLGPEPA
jgi:oligopeptidase A